MDKEIAEQFRKKNSEILKNKLKLDVSNNLSTLTLSLNHILKLEMDAAMPKFSNIYIDADAVPHLEEQQVILKKLSLRFLDETKKYLKNKKHDLIETIDKIEITSSLDVYYELILSSSEEFSNNLRVELKQYIETCLMMDIKTLNKEEISFMKQDFVYERIFSFLIDNVSRRLIDKTVEQLQVRNQTLMNNAKAAYDHYYLLENLTEIK